MSEIVDLLRAHEYRFGFDRFGFDTNCSCGAPSIWYWDDYVKHIEKLRLSPRNGEHDGMQ